MATPHNNVRGVLTMGQVFTQEATSRLLQIEEDGSDLRLHYNDCDPGAGGDTVLMLHGSGPGASNWANFSRNITPLTDLGYRVILLDFAG